MGWTLGFSISCSLDKSYPHGYAAFFSRETSSHFSHTQTGQQWWAHCSFYLRSNWRLKHVAKKSCLEEPFSEAINLASHMIWISYCNPNRMLNPIDLLELCIFNIPLNGLIKQSKVDFHRTALPSHNLK